MLASCVTISSDDLKLRRDLDGDGYLNTDDCAPNDPDIGMPEWWLDDDGDGVGGAAKSATSCEAPEGYVESSDDCDDADPTAFPGAVEVCDVVDNDCNGEVDDAEEGNPWYAGEVCRLAFEDATAVFYGESAGDQAGAELAQAFDHDGDGVNDVLIGAPEYGEQAGRVYLMYGGIAPGVHDLDLADASFTGADDDRIGRRVAVGDLDGDGADEIVVPALRHTVDKQKDGAVYIFAGGSHRLGSQNPSEAIELYGANSWSRLGFGVELPGDLTGDGVADLLASSPYDADDAGVVYLFAGPLESGSSDIAAVTVTGTIAGGGLGSRMFSVGDVTGDGEDDLALADEIDGRVWLFAGPLSGDIDTDAADMEWVGSAESTFGNALCAPGDWNGDGVAELLVGAPSDSTGEDKGGSVFVISADSGSGLAADLATAVYVGEAAGISAGVDLACGQDLDGDGMNDLLVGADFWGSNSNGLAALVYGEAAEGTQQLLLADARVEGGPNAQVGGQVALVGDLTGNGSPDVLVSAVGAAPNGQGSGAVALISADWD
jgi:hypothetical protein